MTWTTKNKLVGKKRGRLTKDKDEENQQGNKDVIKVGVCDKEEDDITKIKWKDVEVSYLITILDEINEEFMNLQTNKVIFSKYESILSQKVI